MMNGIAEYNRGGIPPADPELRYDADVIEDESPLTDMEKRIRWICDAWKDAQEIDTHEEWKDVRMMIYGATQTFNYADGRHEDRRAFDTLRDIAFENSCKCIQAGRY